MLFIAFIGLNKSFAQIRISENSGTIHTRAILEIDSDKGVILPSAEDFEKFPNYSTAQKDFYIDDEQMQGMLIFNKDDKRLYLFDGDIWLPSNAKNPKSENEISLLRSTGSDIVVTTVLNISTTNVVPFNQFQSLYGGVVNNANVTAIDQVASDGLADTYQITQTGWYKINPSIEVKNSGGISLGNNDATVVLKASFVNDPANSSTPYSKWWAVMQHNFSLTGLLISGDGLSKVMNFEYVRHFNAGDRFRVEVGIRNPGGLAAGAGITYECNNEHTFLYIEKLY